VSKILWWLVGLVCGGLVVWFFRPQIEDAGKKSHIKYEEILAKMKKEEETEVA
jgi:uncharacterized membrane protein YgaE (UPF0421/DUF939 family)